MSQLYYYDTNSSQWTPINIGAQGSQGYQGYQSSVPGPQGDTGSQGSTGPQGNIGAQGNQGSVTLGTWQSNTLISSTLGTSATQIIGQTVTGYSKYFISLSIEGNNGDAVSSRNLTVTIRQGTSTILDTYAQRMQASQLASVHMDYLITGLTAGFSYTFYGYANQGGSSAGTINNATITILGMS